MGFFFLLTRQKKKKQTNEWIKKKKRSPDLSGCIRERWKGQKGEWNPHSSSSSSAFQFTSRWVLKSCQVATFLWLGYKFKHFQSKQAEASILPVWVQSVRVSCNKVTLNYRENWQWGMIENKYVQPLCFFTVDIFCWHLKATTDTFGFKLILLKPGEDSSMFLVLQNRSARNFTVLWFKMQRNINRRAEMQNKKHEKIYKKGSRTFSEGRSSESIR